MSTTSHTRHSYEHYKSQETFIWALQVTWHSYEHYKSRDIHMSTTCHTRFIWALQVTRDIHMNTISHMRIFCSRKAMIVCGRGYWYWLLCIPEEGWFTCQEPIALPDVQAELINILSYTSRLQCQLVEITRDYYIALFPGTQQKSERSAWYSLFMHVQAVPLHSSYNSSTYVSWTRR